MFCFVDFRISKEEEISLKSLGLKPIKVPKCSTVYNAICGHPDIQLCILNKDKPLLLVNKNLPKEFKKTLLDFNINYIETINDIFSPYPNNIALNALITNEYFIHKLSNTDYNLKTYMCKENKTFIDVKQGYTKCSCLQLTDNAIITNDFNILKTLSKLNFDILHLPYGDIELQDFEYGFIGGVGGMISKNKLALFGSLDHYKYGEEVKEFLKKHNITPIYLRDSKLYDRGSLFVV